MQVKDFFSSSAKLADLTSLRRRRVIQISAVTGFGLFASSLVARGITFDIFLLGLFSLIVTGSLAYKYYVTTSSYLLLGAMSSMLFALSATGAGVFDIAMIGYPGVIIFAALLGGIALFGTVLSLVDNARCGNTKPAYFELVSRALHHGYLRYYGLQRFYFDTGYSSAYAVTAARGV